MHSGIPAGARYRECIGDPINAPLYVLNTGTHALVVATPVGGRSYGECIQGGSDRKRYGDEILRPLVA